MMSFGVKAMNERLRNLLPNDRLKVFQQSAFYEDVEDVLTFLYQPLIQMTGIAVFQMLWKEAKYKQAQTSLSHHQLMNSLNMNLDDFYEARKRLEAIGLLSTYKEEGTYTTFYYVLKRPLSAIDFFDEPMLSILLEHQIGKEAHQRLKNKLVKSNTLPSNVKQVTKSFDDVFTTVKPPMNQKVEKPTEKEESVLQSTNLPIEWLHKILAQQNIDSKPILTRSNLQYIERLSKIYDVDVLELEKAILWAVNEEHQFDRHEFQDMCKDIYYKKHGNIPPRLYAKSTVENEIAASQTVEKKLEQSKQQKPLTKEEKLIQHFEAITHRELLEDLSPSGKASIDEINMITDIMEQHGLTQPVMNVLIDYVLKRSSNKLNQKFIDRVAASWSREGIKTAKEAFKVAKRDYQQFKTGKQKQPTRKQSARKGVVPEWYDEQKKKQEEQYLKPSKTASKEDIEKKQEELEAFFKQFK